MMAGVVEALFPTMPLQGLYHNLSYTILHQFQNDCSLPTEVASCTRSQRYWGNKELYMGAQLVLNKKEEKDQRYIQT